jgi:hypothetical protein
VARGLQCAGTTGQAGTSLAEFNFNASATDWYNVSYVGGFDNRQGHGLQQRLLFSEHHLYERAADELPAELRVGGYCLAPAPGTTPTSTAVAAPAAQATCVVANWAGFAQNTSATSTARTASTPTRTTRRRRLHTCPTRPTTIDVLPAAEERRLRRRRRRRRPAATVASINSGAWYRVINTNSGRCGRRGGAEASRARSSVDLRRWSGQPAVAVRPHERRYYRVMVRRDVAGVGRDRQRRATGQVPVSSGRQQPGGQPSSGCLSTWATASAVRRAAQREVPGRAVGLDRQRRAAPAVDLQRHGRAAFGSCSVAERHLSIDTCGTVGATVPQARLVRRAARDRMFHRAGPTIHFPREVPG